MIFSYIFVFESVPPRLQILITANTTIINPTTTHNHNTGCGLWCCGMRCFCELLCCSQHTGHQNITHDSSSQSRVGFFFSGKERESAQTSVLFGDCWTVFPSSALLGPPPSPGSSCPGSSNPQSSRPPLNRRRRQRTASRLPSRPRTEGHSLANLMISLSPSQLKSSDLLSRVVFVFVPPPLLNFSTFHVSLGIHISVVF